MVSSTPRPHFTPGKDAVPIVQEAGWAPGPVWTGGKSRPHRNSIPDRPTRSQSLYRLSYPAHKLGIETPEIDPAGGQSAVWNLEPVGEGVSCLVLRRSGSEFDRLPSSSVEDRNEWSCTSAVPICPPGWERGRFYRELHQLFGPFGCRNAFLMLLGLASTSRLLTDHFSLFRK